MEGDELQRGGKTKRNKNQEEEEEEEMILFGVQDNSHCSSSSS